MQYDSKDRTIIENFEDGTKEGNPVVVAEVTRENPDYYGNLFSNAEAMLQVCKDLNGLNTIGNTEATLQNIEGLQNRARTILTELGIPL